MARRTPQAPPAPQSQMPPVNPWLRWARTQPYPVQVGTLAAGNAGGQASSFVTWNPGDIPEVPAWAAAIDLHVTMPVAITIPASGGAVRMSPYAPYSAFSLQMILAGAPEWPNTTSLVPFWLDEITNTRHFDPFMVGPVTADGDLPTAIAPWYNEGTNGPTFDAGANDYIPGETVSNATGAPVTVNTNIRFTVRIRLQRRETQMWGMIPLGDPQNRPQMRMQLNSLIGTQPENCLFMDTGVGTPTAVVDTGGIEVEAVFRTKSLDAMPQGTGLTQPQVGLGLNITYDNSFGITNAGAINWQYQRTAQIYTSIHHLFINNGYAIDPDYFGLWLTQNRASARWEYDDAAGSMQDYYTDVLRRYHRYLPVGHMLADLENGVFPDIPRETPYNGLMSPDATYAAAAGVAPTPNMATAFRLPSGTSISSAYAAIYTFGLVKVPY